ncbi:DUF3426 domain-containing protein [uncultured Pseudodesulfovibrio sp.]|uniref:DUF3426 domain-containing protein n=1 Tax=uncultured Pseudodesulfovibrio sp. TaxID=2035858 RepID=UPI0029C8D61B|nr:DUF3426 domain-containing protein [uncultured Pseudodesulfovibrio sp.]
MIVTCPNCETRYNLPDEKIPAGGAKVKCSKCAQVFKAEHPPVTPEEEVEALLEEEGQGGDTQAGDEFDETFEDVAAGGASSEAEESVDEPQDDLADEGVEESQPDIDDLFEDDDETLPDLDEGASPSDSGADDLDDDIFAGIGEDDTDDSNDLFEDEEDEESEDLFVDDDTDDDGDDADNDADDDESDSVFDKSLSIDEVPQEKGGKSMGCLIILLVVALGLGGAIYFKAWTYMGIDLGDMFKNVPFVGQLFMEETGGDQETAPGESPAERVRKIELKNVKQYYVPNEKVGNLFVVEGKAVNKFAVPKERIKVEVILYDETNNVLTSQAFLCGNVLSQFQLQVQTEKEIQDGLSSDVGILSNNTFIRPDASTPFMAVFFQPPTGVKEFMVKVVDVGDPE